MAEQVTTTNPASGAPVTQAAPAAPMPGGLNPEHIAPDIGQVADGVAINGGLGNALTVDLGDGYLQYWDCEALAFNPARLIDGVSVNPDDQIIAARQVAYDVGHTRRTVIYPRPSRLPS